MISDKLALELAEYWIDNFPGHIREIPKHLSNKVKLKDLNSLQRPYREVGGKLTFEGLNRLRKDVIERIYQKETLGIEKQAANSRKKAARLQEETTIIQRKLVTEQRNLVWVTAALVFATVALVLVTGVLGYFQLSTQNRLIELQEFLYYPQIMVGHKCSSEEKRVIFANFTIDNYGLIGAAIQICAVEAEDNECSYEMVPPKESKIYNAKKVIPRWAENISELNISVSVKCLSENCIMTTSDIFTCRFENNGTHFVGKKDTTTGSRVK